jgi:hypothetical protein
VAVGKDRGGDAEDDTTGDRPATNWDDIYWSLQREYPGHHRFTGRNFGRCPAYVVEGALKNAQESRLTRLKDENQVVANVGYLMLLSKGVNTITPDQINQYEFASQVREAKAAIPKQVATIWLELNKRGCLPPWAIEQVKIDYMTKAAL